MFARLCRSGCGDDGGGGSQSDAGGLDDGRDTVCDDVDACPGWDDREDQDGDGYPDECDVCPGGDDAEDPDGDGFASFCDNCPIESNPAQRDSDVDSSHHEEGRCAEGEACRAP